MKKLLLTIILLSFVCFGFKCNFKNEPELQVFSNVQERTGQGVLVASRSGVSAELKQAIDYELTRLFADVSPLGYSQKMTHAEYVVYVLPNCVLSPVSQTRGFLIRADSYDGTIFDQDPKPGVGRIYAAEYVIFDGNRPSTSYVVCDAPTADADFRNAVRFGPEHILAFNNDRNYYEATKFHGSGINHPLYQPTDRLSREPLKQDVVDYGGRVKINK